MKQLFIVFNLALISFFMQAQEDITSLLPDPFNLPGLQAAGDPEIYIYDDLFDLINGGADVYFEYGFNKVVTQAYTQMNGNASVRIEIYEMRDTDAAYGIMSLSNMGKPVIEKKGVFLLSGPSYKMIQKGIYYIMISYANINEDIQDGLINKISVDVESKIKEMASTPDIIYKTDMPCPYPSRSLYFKGKLALQNATYLDFKIPFKYVDGVFYQCQLFDSMVFMPENSDNIDESVKALTNSVMGSNSAFRTTQTDEGISITEDDKLKYEILSSEDRIVLIKFP